ncbi:hypothetical protein B0E50_09430 [Rhodanobacter sp. C01]|nr:hypothetical protein B0E50_09430 [Rhodanobacter sp. C01]
MRKRIEQGFGWIKTIGGHRRLPLVGMAAVRGWVTWTFAACNLIQVGRHRRVVGSIADVSDHGRRASAGLKIAPCDSHSTTDA